MENEWSTGLCSWCGGDNGLLTCLLACLVPCVQHGMNAEKLSEEEAMCVGDCMKGCLCWTALSCLGFPCFAQMSTRSAIRKKYNIKGSDCGDFCISCWCGPCDLCQQAYQLTSNKEVSAPAAVKVEAEGATYDAPAQH